MARRQGSCARARPDRPLTEDLVSQFTGFTEVAGLG